MPSTAAPPPYAATTPPPSRPGWPAGRRWPGSSGPTSRTWPSCRSREFRYEVDPAGLVRDGGGYRVAVRLLMQLDGYDDAARRRAGPASASCPRGAAGTGCCSPRSTDAALGARATTCSSSPGTGARSRSAPAPACWASSTRTASADAPDAAGLGGSPASPPSPRRCPTTGRARWCVYALSDPAYLDGLQGLPGDPARLDGVAFPVPGGATPDRLAADPLPAQPVDARATGPAARDRLVRHELTHVAVGEHDDRRPGLAGRGDRRVGLGAADRAARTGAVPAAAVAAARRGLTGLPADDTFNDAASARPTTRCRGGPASSSPRAAAPEVALRPARRLRTARDVDGAAARDRLLRERTGPRRGRPRPRGRPAHARDVRARRRLPRG